MFQSKEEKNDEKKIKGVENRKRVRRRRRCDEVIDANKNEKKA